MDPNPAPGFGYADRLKPKRKLGGQLGAEEYQESVESVASKADDLAKLGPKWHLDSKEKETTHLCSAYSF